MFWKWPHFSVINFVVDQICLWPLIPGHVQQIYEVNNRGSFLSMPEFLRPNWSALFKVHAFDSFSNLHFLHALLDEFYDFFPSLHYSRGLKFIHFEWYVHLCQEKGWLRRTKLYNIWKSCHEWLIGWNSILCKFQFHQIYPKIESITELMLRFIKRASLNKKLR